MKYITTILFLLSCNVAFALHIGQEDLDNNNIFGSLIADGIVALFVMVIALAFIIRLFLVVSKKQYVFDVETALSANESYLKQWYSLKRIENNHYVTTSMAEIEAYETRSRMEDNNMIIFVSPGTKYIKCGLNIFSNYQKIRLVGENKIYFVQRK